MTYEQIVAKMQTYYVHADAAMVSGHYAVQFNVVGEGEGAFYLEITEGRVNVQPYDYNDRNALVIADAEILTAITEGKDSYTEAVKEAKITIEGDPEAASILDSIKMVTKAEPVAEPAAEPVDEKVAEAVAEPAAEVAEPVAEKTAEPAAEVAEPVAKKTPAKKAPARKRAASKAASKAKGTKSSKKSAK